VEIAITKKRNSSHQITVGSRTAMLPIAEEINQHN
jgi:hypothetical protein